LSQGSELLKIASSSEASTDTSVATRHEPNNPGSGSGIVRGLSGTGSCKYLTEEITDAQNFNRGRELFPKSDAFSPKFCILI